MKYPIPTYPNDHLTLALSPHGVHSRFCRSQQSLYRGGFFGLAAKVTGFPLKGIRLPSLDEWVFAGNIFRWLRGKLEMTDLPDFLSTSALEWCDDQAGEGGGVIVGLLRPDAIAYSCVDRFTQGENLGFRLVAEL